MKFVDDDDDDEIKYMDVLPAELHSRLAACSINEQVLKAAHFVNQFIHKLYDNTLGGLMSHHVDDVVSLETVGVIITMLCGSVSCNYCSLIANSVPALALRRSCFQHGSGQRVEQGTNTVACR